MTEREQELFIYGMLLENVLSSMLGKEESDEISRNCHTMAQLLQVKPEMMKDEVNI